MAQDAPNVNKSLDSWLNLGGPTSFPELYAKVTLFASLSQFQGMLVPMKKSLLTYKNYTSLSQAWRMASSAGVTAIDIIELINLLTFAGKISHKESSTSCHVVRLFWVQSFSH